MTAKFRNRRSSTRRLHCVNWMPTKTDRYLPKKFVRVDQAKMRKVGRWGGVIADLVVAMGIANVGNPVTQ